MTITAVERIYREISEPEVPTPKREAKAATVVQAVLTRRDVDAILDRIRPATLDELQLILDHSREFKLSSRERNEIALQLTVKIAAKFTPSQPVDSIIFRLGYIETPVGLLSNYRWFEDLLKITSQRIGDCRHHRPPRCNCWREARELLYDVRTQFGERSPESYVALKVWERLEELENASRREPGPGITDP